jgi:serine/threonine protein kinase
MEKDTKFGDFTIVKTISKAGGFADIYEATWGHDGSTVALKVLRPGADKIVTRLFRNECDVLQRLLDAKNSHVVQWRSSGNVGDQHFLAMEKMHGDIGNQLTLKPMTPERATEIVVQVCEALVPVHAMGVVHHDVQPFNMLLDAEGRIKLGDFGIAYSKDEPAPGRRLGIDKYLSPEQREMKRSVPRSDQYSLALGYFQFLTGRQFIRHLTEEMPDPNAYGGKDIPADCIAVLKRMLSRKAEDRFASIEQPLSALKKVLGK